MFRLTDRHFSFRLRLWGAEIRLSRKSGLLCERETGRIDSGRNVMSALFEVEKLLTELSAAEKVQVIQWAARELGDAFPGIESVPGVCGGEPCIVRTRIPVWVLEQARRNHVSESEVLHCYPTLRAEDLANAWAYVRAHPAEIEQQIRENEVA